ncbi:MAG: hypothetical protein D6704_09035 [Nitrospirae bacterium]|nr:MAG: hypothetical protein D6704_09035 [Nitrospirota bacterium]
MRPNLSVRQKEKRPNVQRLASKRLQLRTSREPPMPHCAGCFLGKRPNMFAAAQYSETVALLKTRLAGLFPLSWYRTLCESPTAAAFLKQLQDAGIPLAPDGRLPTKQWLLTHWLVPDYRSVMLRIPRAAQPVIRAWIDRLELENVKYAVRSLASGESIRLEALIDLGPLATIPKAAFRDLTHMADLEAVAQHTTFETPLRATAHRLPEEHGGFIIEAALDRAVYSSLNRTVHRYRGLGAVSLRRLTSQFMTMMVLLWVIRYRLSYGLPAETVLGLAATSSLGKVVDIVHRATAVATHEDLQSLWTDVAGEAASRQSGQSRATSEQTLLAWEHLLWHKVHQAASASLLGPPFGVSVLVGLLLLKELAIRDIAVICQGRAQSLASDALRPLLIHQY